MQTNFKIIIVEDEALIAENLQITLEELGYEVVAVCYNLSQALAAIKTVEFDLALLDINLKNNESGLSVAKMLNEKKCPFVFLTAYSDVATVKEATAQKPAGYLVKPVSSGALFAAIQTALLNSQNTNEVADDDCFFVKIGNQLKRISWKDVYLITSEKNYVSLKTPDSRELGYLIRSTLQQTFQQLMPISIRKNFVQINRSQLVRVIDIVSLNGNELQTKFGDFEVGDSYRAILIKQLQMLK